VNETTENFVLEEEIFTDSGSSDQFCRLQNPQGHSREYNINLESGWVKPPNYTPEPEPVKKIDISIEDHIIFKFTFFNNGENATIGFFADLPTNWSAKPIPDRFYENFTNSSDDDLNVTIYPSIDRENSRAHTPYLITLTAFVIGEPEVNVSVTFTLFIEFWPFPKLSAQNNTLIFPKEAYVNCSVVNMGNGEDNFEMNVVLAGSSKDIEALTNAGWNVEIYSGEYTKILKIGEKHEILIKFTIPISTPAYDNIQIKLIATSVKDPFHQDSEKNLVFNVLVGVYKSIILSRDVTEFEYTEDPMQINFTVTNIGNFVDNDIYIFISKKPDNWNAILNLEDIPEDGLAVGQSVDVWLTITAPK
jgi:hypothetical protein